MIKTSFYFNFPYLWSLGLSNLQKKINFRNKKEERSKNKNKKIIIISLLLCATGLFLLCKLLFFSVNKFPYMSVLVQKGNIEVSVLATGIIKPHRLVAVGARATGRIISLNVSPGNHVHQGDLLAKIDPIPQENELRSRESVLAANQARLAEQETQLLLALQNLERHRTLISVNAVSQVEFDNAKAQAATRQAQIDALKAQITQSEVEVETAKINLGYTSVTAPFNGTILATMVQEGQNVNAVQSVPTIVILGDLATMTIQAEISEADILKIHQGQKLYFNVVGNPERRYDSTLEVIEPAPASIRNDASFNANVSSSLSNSGAIYYNGLFNVANDDAQLRTYMTAEIHILLGKAENVLLIPSDALSLQEYDGFYTVRVLEKDNNITIRRVKTGLNNKTMVEILSGLKEGEKVIIGHKVKHDIKNADTNY